MDSSIEISTTTVVGMRGLDALCRLDAVHARHAHVHQHQLRLELVDDGQRRFAGVGLADRLEAGRGLDHVAGDVPEDRLVVDGDDGDRHIPRVSTRPSLRTMACAGVRQGGAHPSERELLTRRQHPCLDFRREAGQMVGELPEPAPRCPRAIGRGAPPRCPSGSGRRRAAGAAPRPGPRARDRGVPVRGGAPSPTPAAGPGRAAPPRWRMSVEQVGVAREEDALGPLDHVAERQVAAPERVAPSVVARRRPDHLEPADLEPSRRARAP